VSCPLFIYPLAINLAPYLIAFSLVFQGVPSKSSTYPAAAASPLITGLSP